MPEIVNVVDFLKRAAEKTGFVREKYVEKNIPTAFGNVAVIMFFGDMRAEFVLSSFLLQRIKELHPSKYIILCSYPGRSGLYPYADEYWSLHDESAVRSLLDNAVGFNNLFRERLLFQEQQLNRYFETVLKVDDYLKYYDNGFTKDFFDEFQWIVYSTPSVPSAKIEFNRSLAQKSGYKVLIYPAKTMKAWSKGREVIVKSRIDFWHVLARKLLQTGFQPVVYQDHGSFDISKELESECIYCSDNKALDVLGVMRTTGCVLDVFNGVARWATLARTPFIACAERKRYNMVKDWEIDDLCNNVLPHGYIFSFPTIIESGYWNELITNIVNKMESFITQLNRDEGPSTAEQSVVVPYGLVKKRKQQKIGTRFIKVPKI